MGGLIIKGFDRKEETIIYMNTSGHDRKRKGFSSVSYCKKRS